MDQPAYAGRGGYYPRAELVKPLPEGLLDAKTWTIPYPSVLLLLMEQESTREAVYLWGQGMITLRKQYAAKKSAEQHWRNQDGLEELSA